MATTSGAPADPATSGAPAGRAAPGTGEPLLDLADVRKTYGLTTALAGASLTVAPGEVVGLIGHNGAGKSTLMRVIVGLTRPDAGVLRFGGADVGPGYGLAASRAHGIRIAYQELSLAPELKVFENVLLGAARVTGRRWRRRSAQLLGDTLDEIFPGHGIPLRQPVHRLSLARRQMLEIAAATVEVGTPMTLLILDEPTSALSHEQAENLFAHLRRLRDRGVATVLISHKLGEILRHTDRVVVMRDGAVVAEQPTGELDHDGLVGLMGGLAPTAAEAGPDPDRADRPDEELLAVTDARAPRLDGVSIALRAGEVVGLAGLEGQGQQELLAHLWRHRRSGRGVRVRGRVAFVTGDRAGAGVFPLWTVGQNVAVGVMRELARWGVSARGPERRVVDDWMARLSVRGRSTSPITDLSGGNQQKALIARALASSARIVLFDDPFRGVDIETRRAVYALVRQEADAGRGFLWFTTENAELAECDRVYVMSGGRVSAELAESAITEEAVIAASFRRAG